MLRQSKSPLMSLPGAVPAEGPDEGVAAHYGDLFREQRALADGSGFVDLSHRGVVTVSGPERLSWLHLLITQHVTELPPGQATDALILTGTATSSTRSTSSTTARRSGRTSSRARRASWPPIWRA
ncbi:hypothetical protein GCM10020221_20390 [Streptomyces thioluteus]|uniref:Aminomethyltransferase folate-binding domain-containing protein n=1 Tax=Streptomyces thioluteus TaxID=66431 RepID=A0ABN3WS18_STRTU